jgi:hypothetical protein
MKIRTKEDIEAFVYQDAEMMNILRIARDLGLPDWWIGAGFLRNRIWDERWSSLIIDDTIFA